MAKPSARGSNTKLNPAKPGAKPGAKARAKTRAKTGANAGASAGAKAGTRARGVSRRAAPPAPDVTFRQFQALIRERYYATDSARGVPGTFMWLIEEVGELATSLQDNAPGKTPTAKDRANLVEEFADVIAWLTTLANIANVDLAEALTKYTDVSRVKGVKS